MKTRYAIVVLAVLVVMARGCAPASAQDRPYDPRDRYAETDNDSPADRDDRADDQRQDRRNDGHRSGCTCRHDRRGVILGFGFGGGAGNLCFERAGRKHEPDPEYGGLGHFRCGFGVSNSIAFTVEAHGYSREANGSEWNGGALLGALTWWPDGSGFYLRVGAGYGGVELTEPHPDGQTRTLERDGGAALFGMGYEWRVGRKFAIGVGVDAFGIDLKDTDDLTEMTFGAGGASVQFNWYL